jgi:hypothetical protein
MDPAPFFRLLTAFIALYCLAIGQFAHQVWSIGASAPIRTGGIGFAMFCGIMYMFIAISEFQGPHRSGCLRNEEEDS